MKKFLLLLGMVLYVSTSYSGEPVPSLDDFLTALTKAGSQNREYFSSLQIQGIALKEESFKNYTEGEEIEQASRFKDQPFNNPFFSSAYKSNLPRFIFFKNGALKRLDQCWFFNENETGFADFEKQPLASTLKDKVRLSEMISQGEKTTFHFTPRWHPKKDEKTGSVRLIQMASPEISQRQDLERKLNDFFVSLYGSMQSDDERTLALFRKYPTTLIREIYDGEEVILCSFKGKKSVVKPGSSGEVEYQIRVVPKKNYSVVFHSTRSKGTAGETILNQKRKLIQIGDLWLSSFFYTELYHKYYVGKDVSEDGNPISRFYHKYLTRKQVANFHYSFEKVAFYYDQTIKPGKDQFTRAALKEYDLRSDAERKIERETRMENFTLYAPWLKDPLFQGIEMTDWHIHLRGGMTAEKAAIRSQKTGVRSGVLENFGKYWPLSSNEKLEEFIAQVEKVNANLPSGEKLKIGIQVNDRDWYQVLDPKLRKRLDYILADTMIMDTDPHGIPQKLWLLPKDYQADPDQWMERYMKHNLQILDEPIDILAHPTWLPEFIVDQYDRLWTEERMLQIINKAVEKGIALEIQAETPYPKDRFIELALRKGAIFSFGSNNHDDRMKSTDRWRDVLQKYGKKMKLFSPKTSLP